MDEDAREIRARIEYRADDTRESPGRIHGTLLTYGRRAATRNEVFLPGSLSWAPDGVTLGLSHIGYSPETRGMAPLPVGRFVPQARDGAVVVDYPLPDTERGRIAAALVRDGTFRDLSAEFHAVEETTVAGVREIRKAMLLGAGLVRTGDYGGPRVEVRARAGLDDLLWLLTL